MGREATAVAGVFSCYVFIRPSWPASSVSVPAVSARATEPPPSAAPPAGARPEEPPPLAVERGHDAERPLLVRPFFSFQVSTLESERVRVHHDPITSFGVSLGWRRLKLSVSKGVKLGADDPNDPDNPLIRSDALNISLAISVPVRRRELVLMPFFSSVKGVGIEANPVIDNSGNDGAWEVARPDMRLRTFGVDAVYCLNSNFSYDDWLLEFKPRERSSATFLLRSSVGRVSLSSDGRPIGEDSVVGLEKPLGRTTSFDADYAGANVGFAYQWLPIGRLAVMGLFAAGGTFSNARVSYSDGSRDSGLSLRPGYTGNWGVGYIGYAVHFGLMGYYTREIMSIGGEDVTIAAPVVPRASRPPHSQSAARANRCHAPPMRRSCGMNASL